MDLRKQTRTNAKQAAGLPDQSSRAKVIHLSNSTQLVRETYLQALITTNKYLCGPQARGQGFVAGLARASKSKVQLLAPGSMSLPILPLERLRMRLSWLQTVHCL